MLLPVPATLMEPMAAQLIPAEALPMFMAAMAVRLITIMILILPTHVVLKVAQLIPMTARGQLMERTVAQLPGVMAVAPLIVPMAARLHGVMVPVPPKVRVVVQQVGVTVPELQHLLAEKPEAGAGKRFMA